MSRRVKLPGASELFRDTEPTAPGGSRADGAGSSRRRPPQAARVGPGARHEEKITVYVSRTSCWRSSRRGCGCAASSAWRSTAAAWSAAAMALALADLESAGPTVSWCAG